MHLTRCCAVTLDLGALEASADDRDDLTLTAVTTSLLQGGWYAFAPFRLPSPRQANLKPPKVQTFGLVATFRLLFHT